MGATPHTSPIPRLQELLRKRIAVHLVDAALLSFFGQGGLRGRDLTESHQQQSVGMDDDDESPGTSDQDDDNGAEKTQGALYIMS